MMRGARIVVVTVVGMAAAAAFTGCGGNSPSRSGDAGTDAGGEAKPAALLPFTPSNINIAGVDVTKLADETISGNCELRTVEGGLDDCFNKAWDATMTQSDGSKIHVKVVKSLRVEAAGHIRLSVISGGLPIAIVALGDFTMLGTIDGGATGMTQGPGGAAPIGNMKGPGLGGGPAATGVTHTPGASAGGASFCGVGGQGVLEMGAAGAAGPASSIYGTAMLIPLVGGSAGGGGDIGAGAGGGAVQLVAGGTFTLGAGAAINVGGGGGPQGGISGQEAGGGGSGGAILIEATTIKIAGTLAANGGGGGGGAGDGKNGAADATPPAGGPGALTGGNGGAGATIDGTTPATPASAGAAPAGGGGAGRIRLNSMSGQADLTGGTISPAASTSCATQGMVAP